ncbi:MAG: GNAT family N-acetyltransferase [Leifsonia sp.]
MPSPLFIRRADFADPYLEAFLQEHLDDMESTSPPESRHALDLTGLQHPHVRLWTAMEGGRIVGTVALSTLQPGHDELKSMRTDAALRGRGIGAQLLETALDDARSRGVRRVSLETGSFDFFAPARRLYERAGFKPCAPFASYIDDGNSMYFTLELAATAST